VPPAPPGPAQPAREGPRAQWRSDDSRRPKKAQNTGRYAVALTIAAGHQVGQVGSDGDRTSGSAPTRSRGGSEPLASAGRTQVEPHHEAAPTEAVARRLTASCARRPRSRSPACCPARGPPLNWLRSPADMRTSARAGGSTGTEYRRRRGRRTVPPARWQERGRSTSTARVARHPRLGASRQALPSVAPGTRVHQRPLLDRHTHRCHLLQFRGESYGSPRFSG
jgi:hypothetical protein